MADSAGDAAAEDGAPGGGGGEIVTALDYRLDDLSVRLVGRCVVHTSVFQDVGLIWPSKKRDKAAAAGKRSKRKAKARAGADEAAGEEGGEEDLELQLLRQLGLPAAFGTSKARETPYDGVAHPYATSDDDGGYSEVEAEEVEGVEEESAAGNGGPGMQLGEQGGGEDAAGAAPPAAPGTPEPTAQLATEWQQAYDYSTGHYYYFRERTQETTWEAPREGFNPVPGSWPGTALPSQPEQQQAAGRLQSGWVSALELEASLFRQAVAAGEAAAAQAALDLQQQQQQQQQAGGRARQQAAQPPRVETTGMMQAIPEPAGAHLYFGSSDDEGRPGGAQPMELLEGSMQQLAVGAAAAPAGREAMAAAAGAQEQSDDDEAAFWDLPAAPLLLPLPATAEDRGGGAAGRRGGGLPAELPRKLEKYWLQRYSLFSRYDSGVRIDEQGWYSATPEVIAAHQAQRAAAALGPACVAADPFAGVGGNVIQLALACGRVVAVEIDGGRMALLRHNAEVYGVAPKVDFICDDFFRVAPALKADVVFYSPPWGGPEYSRSAVYDVRLMGAAGFGLPELLEAALGTLGASGVIAFLPRNCDLRQISECLPAGQAFCEVERAVLNGVCKGITVYYGSVARDPRAGAAPA